MDIIKVAKLAHEFNRAYCSYLGDNSQVEWEKAPEWQRKSAILGVQYRLDNPTATPEDMHNSWLAVKEDEGWVYGEKKDEDKKEHPCMVPYKKLPLDQQLKDELFSKAIAIAIELEG